MTIVSNTLSKMDIQNSEDALKILEVGDTYISHWHQSLSHFISRTNQKFESILGLLDEVSWSDNEHFNPNLQSSRRNSRSRDARIGSPMHNPHKSNTKQASLILQMIKTPESKELYSDHFENSINDDDHMQQRTDEEQLSTRDLNSNTTSEK